jgi:integral membrane protein
MTPEEKPLMTEPWSDAPTTLIDAERTAKALPPFRIMAFIVGFGLLLLVTEMILKYGLGNHVLDWWQMPHGFLYMLYLAATANLGFAARWPLQKMVLTMLAGCVPFLSFWVEHRRTQEVRRQLGAYV